MSDATFNTKPMGDGAEVIPLGDEAFWMKACRSLVERLTAMSVELERKDAIIREADEVIAAAAELIQCLQGEIAAMEPEES